MHSSVRSRLWPAYLALLFGNFVIGFGVLMPVGLLNDLNLAFAQNAATTGTLISYGAAVLCVEAPLLAWLTNRIDRRVLLAGALALYAAGHLASAFATDFHTLLVARLIMIGGAAAFTPQAASAIALLVPVEQRSTAVATVFLGWPIASALGVPLASLLGAYAGWSAAYLIVGAFCVVATIAVWLTLPSNLFAPRLHRQVWLGVLSNGRIWLILSVTMIFIAGQFTVYPYLAHEIKERFDATPSLIATMFLAYGLAGVIGSVVSATVIGKLGAAKTVFVHLSVVFAGLFLWWLSGPWLVLAVGGLLAFGYGGGPAISAQQARLINADPDAGSASVALNTSVLYAGQAMGTALGALLLTHHYEKWSGLLGAGLLLTALTLSWSAQALGRQA